MDVIKRAVGEWQIHGVARNIDRLRTIGLGGLQGRSLPIKPHDTDPRTMAEQLADHRSHACAKIEDEITLASWEAEEGACPDKNGLMLEPGNLVGISWTVNIFAHCRLRPHQSRRRRLSFVALAV